MTKRLCRCTCTVCGAVEFVGGSGGRFRCQACRTAGRFPVGAFPYDGIGMNEAHSAVRRAVKRGELQPAKPHPGIQEAQRKARAYYEEVLV